jgi:5'-nucleotidase
MWLNDVAIDPAETYTVSANSFIATGGDNFRALTLGTNKQDTGKTDLQATVDYLAEHASDAPLPVDYAQHGVGARVDAGPFAAGDAVTIDVDSLSMTGGGTSTDVTDVTDSSVVVSYGSTDLGTFPVTTALPTTAYDVPGAASVSFPLPSGLHNGTQWFTLTGAATGTVSRVPVAVRALDSSVSGTAADITWGQAGSVSVTVTPGTATGTVELYDGTTKIGEGTLTGDATTITVPAEALAVGTHTLTLKYLGDSRTQPSQSTVSVTVVKASTTVTGSDAMIQWSKDGSVTVSVAPAAATGSVELYDGTTKLGAATLSGGSASIALAAKSLEVGSHALTVKYLGSATHAASQGTVTVTITKSKPKVKVAKPKAIKAGTKAKIKVALGEDVRGKVGIVLKKVGGTFKIEVTRKVVDGKVVAKVRVPKKGKFRVKVKYLGNDHTRKGWSSTHLWVS